MFTINLPNIYRNFSISGGRGIGQKPPSRHKRRRDANREELSDRTRLWSLSAGFDERG